MIGPHRRSLLIEWPKDEIEPTITGYPARRAEPMWDAGGLIEGLRQRLTDDDASLLEKAIEGLTVIWEGNKVRSPGREIWKSLAREDFDRAAFRSKYQEHLVRLISMLRKRTAFSSCCDYHTNLFEACCEHVRDPHENWFTTFLEILTSTAVDLHFQFSSAIDLLNAKVRLSRFMKLKAFIKNHSTSPYTEATERRYRNLLSPRFRRGARRSVWKNTELGMWHGRIGSYPAFKGATERYKVWCEGIKPFATFTDVLDAEFDREGSPVHALHQLGIPFRKGQYWIELSYHAREAAFFHEGDRVLRLAIPTHIESAGNWAFVPDRDSPALSNHARDLTTGGRGLTEIIHGCLDIPLLDDAIVWQTPTDLDWPEPYSPFAEGITA